MSLLRRWLAGIPAYLWSGWGAVASLCLLLAAWEGVSLAYGQLILPDPAATFARLHDLFAAGAAWPELAVTARRAMTGLALAVSVGSLLGLAAGVSLTASMMARPLVTVLLGMQIVLEDLADTKGQEINAKADVLAKQSHLLAMSGVTAFSGAQRAAAVRQPVSLLLGLLQLRTRRHQLRSHRRDGSTGRNNGNGR